MQIALLVTSSILNASHVTVTPSEAMECLVTSTADVSARKTLTERSVVNVKKDTTTTLHAKSVTAILQEWSSPSKDVVQSLQENFANAKKESLEESVINAKTCFGT